MIAFLAVLVPEADAVIGHLRERWDPSVRHGLGAHITIRYPFLTAALLGAGDVERMAAVVASVPAFTYTLMRVERFPTTVFLDPDPLEPFAALREAVEREFRGRLPADTFLTYVPHLSVARNVRAEQGAVVEAIESMLANGAITARATELVLLERDEGPWRESARFSLGEFLR